MTDPISVILVTLDAQASTIGKTYHAEALKNVSAPFVFWLQRGESTRKTLSGYTDLMEASYEIHCVSKNLDTLNTQSGIIKTEILKLIGEHTGIIFEDVSIDMESPEIHEVEVGLYRKVYLVTINYILSD